MSLAVEFSTITQMFDAITSKFLHETRPVIKQKIEGEYRGITYAQLRSDVEHFAVGLSSTGISRGDCVALISENRSEWVVADIGMLYLGAINVPLYTTLTPKQIEFILNDANVKFIILSNQFQLNKVLKIVSDVPSLQKIIVMNKNGVEFNEIVLSYSDILEKGKQVYAQKKDYLEQEKSKTKSEDLLTLIYTSGTTGTPKGVMLTHGNMVSNIQASAPCILISSSDTLLSFLPLCHSFERMAGYYTAMACGATIAYAESIDTVRENLLEVRPTIMASVPRLFEKIQNRILKQIADHPPIKQKIFHWAIDIGKKYAVAKKANSFSPLLTLQRWFGEKLVYHKIKARTGGRVRFFVSGGAALGKELGEFFEAIGIVIIEGYGLSESSPVISVNRLDKYKFGSVGLPIPGVEVKIAEDGEILACGPNIMKGYWNNQKETDESLDSDGWLHTGDIGMFDEEGFLHITDRKKHLFVSSGGKNIAPQPIENSFLQSPFIDQFVLIGDKKMFCSALIVPDFDALKDFAKRESLKFTSVDELVNTPQIKKLFDEEVSKLQQDFALYERVRKFTLLIQPLTIESGELTPTLKIRRKVVEERYKHLIEKMYEGLT